MSKKNYGLHADTVIVDEKFATEESVDVVDLNEEEKVEPIVRTGTVVKCDALRVRTDCKKDADVISFIPAGTKCSIIGEPVNGFYNVTIDGDIKICGWCMVEFISLS